MNPANHFSIDRATLVECERNDIPRLISEGLRQEVKPWNLRTTIISPGAVATESPSSITEPDIAMGISQYYEQYAIPAHSFARAAAFAISQPEDVDINEILFRPTRQEL
jgi:NADP-dependent 3-hydroxy acid dehydrogenase YdfG